MEDRWPQRSRFLELLEDWQTRNNKTSKDFADAIGKSLASFYTYRTRTTSRPPQELLVKMADVLGVSITEFIADPGATIAGQAVKGLTEKEQFFAEMMFNKYRDPDLTEEDRQLLFEDWTRDYDRLKAMKARHTKP